MTPLVLSLFPGIGMLDAAFELEGYCVVRGPDVLWGGDIRVFHPPAARFDGIIGGPPCQSFSSLAHLVRANGHEPRFGNLIPEFERCVIEAQPQWFLMENVRAAPVPTVAGYGVHDFLLNNCWLPGNNGDGMGQEQERLRRFSFGVRGGAAPDLRRWIDTATLMLPDPEPCCTSEGNKARPMDGKEAVARRSRTVTALGPEHLENLAESTRAYTKAPPVVSKPGLEIIGKFGKAKRKELAAVKRRAVNSHGEETPVKIGGSGKVKSTAVARGDGGSSERMGRFRLADACRLQGLPEDFLDDAPFTAKGKLKCVANGVPIPMGLALARAIKEWLVTRATA